MVTGGAGFIGSHLVDAYLEAGHEVAVLDNFSTGVREQIPQQVKVYELDLNSPDLEAAVAEFGPTLINHHAAQIDVRRSVEDPSFDAEVNILGSIRLLEAARKSQVTKFLFASSGGAVYGEAEQLPTPETQPALPISPYGVAKLSVEHYLYYYHKVYGLPYVALRYSNVYGPRQNPHGEAGVVAICFERLLSGQSFVINGEGTQTRDFVYVADVVRANLLASETEYVGPLNVGTGRQTSINELVEKMASAIDYEEPIAHGPGKKGEQQQSCLSYQLAHTTLGFSPQTSIEEGLQATAHYFVQKHS